MLDIRIYTPDGKAYKASECDTFLEHWQKFEPSEFLKNYLLRNLPVYCKDDGGQDEQFKIIKGADGKPVWMEGDTRAGCDGLRYEVVITEEDTEELEHFNPLADLPAVVQTHINRLLMQAYYEGHKAAMAAINNY